MADSMLPPLPDTIPLDIPPAATTPGGHLLDDDDNNTTPGTITGITPGIVPLTQFTSLRLKSGSWLFTWGKESNFDAPLTFGLSDGTFRFDSPGGILGSVRASGDMYRRKTTFVPRHKVGQIWIGPLLLPGPAPPTDQGIPIFGIKEYQAYFRVTKLSGVVTNNSFVMEFSRYNWQTTEARFESDAAGRPVVAENYIVTLTWGTAPVGWPSTPDYLTGEVKIKSTGVSAGFIRMGWVSERFRKIGLEIDAVSGCRFPAANGAQRSLRQLLEAAGLQVTSLVNNENNIPDKANGALWEDTDLHEIMIAHRLTVDLEKEWAYHCLVVPHILHAGGQPFGLMYDSIGSGDSNNIAREGFAVAAKSRTGTGAGWGTEANKDLEDSADAFVRTTIHEFSHALGLHHPEVMDEPNDQTYTCPTVTIVDNAATTGVPFPTNIRWSHTPVAQKRLWHYPDIRIRPGGIQFTLLGKGQGGAPWVPPNGGPVIFPPIKFDTKPVLTEVPLGAPVRVEVTLKNEGDQAFEVPREIGLRGEAMKGDVEDATGMRRTFSPLAVCADAINPLVTLEPGQQVNASMTLFSANGNQGPLFLGAGIHTITSILSWKQDIQQGDPVTMWLEAKTTVLVTGTETASHATAAHHILTEPETHQSLILASNHQKRGIEAIRRACKDETLGPHWACIEARRCARRFSLDGKSDLSTARKLMSIQGIVMSRAEKEKMNRLMSTV